MSPPSAEALGKDQFSSTPAPQYVRQATTDTNPVDLRDGAIDLAAPLPLPTATSGRIRWSVVMRRAS
jgi:hypothetical protein